MQTGYRFLEPQALARVKNLSVVARGVVEGFISGLHSSPYKGFSVEFAEHREYSAGDDPRHLDYRMLARTDRLYVKQYEEETNMRVQVLLDTSGSMGYSYDGKLSKLQYGSYLTAVLAYLMTRQQDSVGLTTFDTEIRLDMPAHSSPRHFNEMMHRLEAIEPSRETDVAETLHKLANRFKRRCLIVLISDLYDEPEEVIRALHHFRHRRHEVILFHVFDKAEIEFPFREAIAFHDLETNERIQVDPAYVRDQYTAQIEAFIENYRRGKATSLVRALSSASKQFAPGEVAAVILLSDGIHNSAGNPLDAARKMGVVVHCVGVGANLRSNSSYRDIQVTGIDCPDRMILNNVARITGSIDAIGLGGRVIQVFLDEDGRQIGQAELTLDDTEGSQQVSFEFRPAIKGRHTYTVRVPPVAEEKIIENNQRSAVSTVVEAGIHVLYIEGTLRAEYGAVVDRFLAKDPDLEFCALVQTRPNVFLKRTNMTDLKLTAIPTDQETINKFDVFILGDIDSSYLRPQQQEMLLRRIREGAGLVMLGGYHSLGPGGYGGTPLGDALPAVLGGRDVGQITESLLPVLTPDGVRHPIFANIAGFFPTQQGPPKIAGLPPLEGCTRIERARPGATVLASAAAESGSMPILAVQPLDRGRTAIFAGDTTRSWQQGPRALDQESPFLRFWGQMVRWLAGRGANVETQASITASTDKASYEPGETIHISAIVRDKEGQGANDAKVVAGVQGPAGRPEQVTLSTEAGPSGHYGGAFEPRSAGGYEVAVEARVGELSLKADKIPLEVGRPNLEFEKLDFDEKLLERIAADAGGRYVPILTADHLIDQLDRRQKKKTVYVERQLYWPPGFWVLFVAVLTTEWILRRRCQLR